MILFQPTSKHVDFKDAFDWPKFVTAKTRAGWPLPVTAKPRPTEEGVYLDSRNQKQKLFS